MSAPDVVRLNLDMCRDGHAEIWYRASQHDGCPLCNSRSRAIAALPERLWPRLGALLATITEHKQSCDIALTLHCVSGEVRTVDLQPPREVVR